MKILIVARGYPTNEYRLNGIFEFDQAKALSKAGIEVFYIALDVRSIRRWRKWGIENKLIDGIKVYSINIPLGNIPNKIRDVLSILALKKIYKIFTQENGKPDLIHSHFISIGYIVAKALYNINIPLILTEHSSEMNSRKIKEYYKEIGEFAYLRMNKIIAVSEYLANNIRRNFNVEVVTIPNVVDLLNFKYNKQERLNIHKEFSFVSMGKLHSDKGMDLLVDSFCQTFHNRKDVYLYIYGEGKERKNLEKLIKKFKLENQIFLPGIVARENIANQMSHSDCFVLASKSETFGVSFIEAMAMGLPVISTKCGGPEDFINESNGILIEVDNRQDLIKAFKRMILNIGEYDGEQISNSTIAKFSGENIALKLMDLYRKILNIKDGE